VTRVVIISHQAEMEFEKIYLNTISEFGKTVAKKLFNKFCRFKDTILLHPYVYGYYYRSKSIRKFILTKSILVLYRVSRSEIEIITLIYGRQNPVTVKRNLRM
jgi:plasmid stabilization system protein ParE